VGYWALSGRNKSILVVLFGAMMPVAAIVQLFLGYVLVPVKHSPRTFIPVNEGWYWLVLEVALGCGLVWKDTRGVASGTWPPV